MLSPNTRALLEAALASIEQDALRNMGAHARDRNVPCEAGVREFQQLVSLYWDLEARIGRNRATTAEAMALCEDMAEASPQRR